MAQQKALAAVLVTTHWAKNGGTASLTGKTGVEMEALTGVSIAALTIYDMCKSLSHNILIREIRLIEKTGGKQDFKNGA